ncbi:MAG: hypothetical protein ACKOAM_02855 [Chakrabartia sp.]
MSDTRQRRFNDVAALLETSDPPFDVVVEFDHPIFNGKVKPIKLGLDRY